MAAYDAVVETKSGRGYMMSRVDLPGPLGIALGPTADRLTTELVEAAMAAASELGVDARLVRRGEEQTGLGALIGIGHQGSFLSLFASPASCRRIIWVGELLQLDGDARGGVAARVARARAWNCLRFPLRPLMRVPLPGPLARARASATLEREWAQNLRETSALARRVDRVVVTSRDRREALARHGIAASAVPFGYSEVVAGPIAPPGRGERDLPIVTIAKLDSRTAGRRSVVGEWRDQEPRLRVLDDVWGSERNALLRRSKVVLNVSRRPGDFVGWRLVLALATGSVVVTEPLVDPFPFVAGEHFVEAPLDGLLDAARGLIADEPTRRRIAEAGQALLTGELRMARCLSRAISS